jgi:hypothetical protein
VLVKFPSQVEVIRSVVSANLPGVGPGYAVLFEDKSVQKDVSCLFQGKIGASRPIYLTGLQNPQKLSVSLNSRG